MNPLFEQYKQLMEELVPFHKFLGMRLVEFGDGRAKLELPFRPELIGNTARSALHGGVISAMADTAGSLALFASVEVLSRVSTVDLRVDYLRPGKPETLIAESTMVRVGKRVGVADVRLFHPSSPEVVIAVGRGAYNISPHRAP